MDKWKKVPQEVIDFIKANSKDMTDKELSETINKQFNLSTTRESIKSIRQYHRIGKGKDGIKSIRQYHKSPVLTETTQVNGYVKIKTADGKWVGKHTFLYEQAHGKVPDGYLVIFLDRNKNNFSLDNLAIVSKFEQLKLSQLGLRFNEPEFTQTGIAIVRHKIITARRGNAKKHIH